VAAKPEKLVLSPETAAALVGGQPRAEVLIPVAVSGVRFVNPNPRALQIEETDFRYCLEPGTSHIEDEEVAKQLRQRAEKYGLKIL
jgi:hypothetical protein